MGYSFRQMVERLAAYARSLRNPAVQAGFTLTELAIVVAFIALVVGAVAAIQNMRESGERARVLKEGGEYVQLFSDFKTRYNYWPGDYPGDGTSKFSGISGNGDGIFSTSPPEGIYAWQQLRVVGMYTPQLARTYPGIMSAYADTITEAVPGQNIPASSVAGGGWVAMEFFVSVASNTFFSNILRMALPTAGSTVVEKGIIAPEQLYAIDKKADDGYPESGKIVGSSPNAPSGGVTSVVTSEGGGVPGECRASCCPE